MQPIRQALPNDALTAAVNFILGMLSRSSQDAELEGRFKEIHQRVVSGSASSVRRVELELLQAGKASMTPAIFLDKFSPQVRDLCDPLYGLHGTEASQRSIYYGHTITLMEDIISEISRDSPNVTGSSDVVVGDDSQLLDDFFGDFTAPFEEDTEPLLPRTPGDLEINTTVLTDADTTVLNAEASNGPSPSPPTPPEGIQDGHKIESNACCEICGYRPKGDPQWFRGSMAKHKKLQHSSTPPVIYKCPFPGCNSQYKNRQDNLRQHQIEKNHFVGDEAASRGSRRQHQHQQHQHQQQQQQQQQAGTDNSQPGADETARRPSKRKKLSQ